MCDLAFYYSGNKPDTAIKIALEALKLATKAHYIKGQALCFNRIGNSHQESGNYAKAMEALLQALKLNESVNNIAGMAQNTHNLGVVYVSVGEYARALAYQRKSKKLYERAKSDGIAISLSMLARTYFFLNQYDSARVYAQLGYEATKKLLPMRLGIPLAVQGDIYSKMGEGKLALEYYRLSLPYWERFGNNTGYSIALLGMATVFKGQHMPDSALVYGKRAYNKSLIIGKYNQQLADAANFLATCYDKSKIADSAVFYFKAAALAKDSLYSNQRFSQLQSLGFDEQLRQIELAGTEEKATEERKHNLQFAGIAVIILSLLTLFLALSRTIIVKENFIKYFNVIVLLAVFEFINLLIHPYLAHLTHDSPPLMLLILIGIGALLVPLHHKLEHWVAHTLTEKNKQIRLAAAKKTIAHLENKELI